MTQRPTTQGRPKIHDPKTYDPTTHDPKTCDPKEAGVQEARGQEAGVQEAEVREAEDREARVRETDPMGQPSRRQETDPELLDGTRLALWLVHVLNTVMLRRVVGPVLCNLLDGWAEAN